MAEESKDKMMRKAASSKRPFIRPGANAKDTVIEMPDDEPESSYERESDEKVPQNNKGPKRNLWDTYKYYVIGIIIIAIIVAIAYWFFAYKPNLEKIKNEERMKNHRNKVKFNDEVGLPLEKVRTIPNRDDINSSTPFTKKKDENIITETDVPNTAHVPYESGSTTSDNKKIVIPRDLIKTPLAIKGDMNQEDVARRHEEENIMKDQISESGGDGDIIVNPSSSSSFVE